MATFVKIKNKTGFSWQAVIRKKGHGKISKVFQAKSDAKLWAAEQEKIIDQKRYKDHRLAEQVTLEDALKKYSEHSKTILKKVDSTLAREELSKKHLLRLLGHKTPLSDITPQNINNYQIERSKEGASSSSIRQELSLISRMYRIANGTWQLPVDNPVSPVDRIPPPPGRTRFLTEDEIKIVLEETKKRRNKKFYLYVLLLIQTGMRGGEAAKINIKDINIEEKTVVIRETKTKTPRVLFITDQVIEEIKSIELEEEGFLFLKAHHRKNKEIMINPGTIFKKAWIYLRKDLNNKHLDKENYPGFPKIEPFKPHDLRHTAASHLLKMGTDIRIIADILGHSSLSMVMRYTHIFNTSKQEHMEKLAKLGK